MDSVFAYTITGLLLGKLVIIQIPKLVATASPTKSSTVIFEGIPSSIDPTKTWASACAVVNGGSYYSGKAISFDIGKLGLYHLKNSNNMYSTTFESTSQKGIDECTIVYTLD